MTRRTTTFDRMVADLLRAQKAGWVLSWEEDADPRVPMNTACIVEHHNEDGDEVTSRLTARHYRKAERHPRYNPADVDAVLATALNTCRRYDPRTRY